MPNRQFSTSIVQVQDAFRRSYTTTQKNGGRDKVNVQVNRDDPCSLFDLLLLQLDRLIIDKDALPLVRLGHSPPADFCRELMHDLLINTLEQDSRRLRSARLDAHGHTHLDGMRKAELKHYKLLSGVFLEVLARLDRRSVADSHQAQYRRVAL